MKKEKCDCEYKMLAALAVGVGLGLVCGLAIGWNGAKYPSDTSFILAFLTALGTVATAIGAVWISYNGQRRYERDKLLDKRYYLEGVVLPALTTTQKNLTDQQILNNRDVDSKYAHALNELARLDSINTFSAIRDEISLVKKINQARSDLEKLSLAIKNEWTNTDLNYLLISRASVDVARAEALLVVLEINGK